MPVDVFISYRGADRVLARRLEQRLRSRWGSRVFRDETSLMPGRSWSEQLLAAMSQANVTLALVGPGWHVREDGEDWVRDELLGAIKAGNPVLPVLVGNADELKVRLGELPEAFLQQAVTVTGELAGFDLHKVEGALRNLGAFGDRRPGGLGRELAEILPEQCDDLIRELVDGRSMLVSGASGSGRGAFLRRIARTVTKQNGLLATSGTNLSARSRRTHCVIASWVDGLCLQLKELPPEDRSVYGRNLVNAVINFGPDLLAREVLRPALLLPLGDDDSDQRILDAARRPTNRWAPFPPERLVSQSMSVLENFVSTNKKPLTLVVDNVESIDGSSKDLLGRLLRTPVDNVRLVLATSAVRESSGAETAVQSVKRALKVNKSLFEKFVSISLHDASIWGTPGTIIQRWLDRHNVQLEKGINERFEDSNPYYALSALWYLVDNGHLIEPARKPSETQDKSSSPDGDIVTWLPARPDEPLIVPSRERLLDHMVEEFIPLRYRSILEAGSLIGRRFSFSAAFAAAHPPESVDAQQPSVDAITRWSRKADQYWNQLESVDPDGSVIVCHRSADNERMINLAQVDLVEHLARQVKLSQKMQWHKALAQYFSKPIADDTSMTLDDKYSNARAAAAHWASANMPRRAADAERTAAALAERALAYPEAQRHYRRAIRLFTQLLANTERSATFNLVEHEDLLILANCLYHLGQMTRLANERRSVVIESSNPSKYFDLALYRLQELSSNLHDKRRMGPTPEQDTTTSRDLPQPNVIRYHIRLCETLSGWVNLEQAEWCSERNPKQSRSLLFDALRHAEAARGEADSRWLLAAASAQLAQQLVDDAMRAQQSGNPVRSHNLSIEAQFHIERVIGLAAVSPEEDQNLEEPRSRAWTVLGQLFQSVAIEPQMAYWAFNRMNDHRHDVSDMVDMMTDRRLGLFLLSMHRGVADEQTVKARDLLERHEQWANESGIAFENSEAQLSLALLELVEQSNERPLHLQKARDHLDRVIMCTTDSSQRQNAYLLSGLLHAIQHDDKTEVLYADSDLVRVFRQADLENIVSSSSDEEVLFAGWRTLLIRLLRWCPYIEKRIGLGGCAQEPELDDDTAWARHQFFSELMKDGELQSALARARKYLESVLAEPVVPSADTSIWRLLESRVPTECYRHAERTRDVAIQLLKNHRYLWGDNDDVLTLHSRNITYAIAVHEWYRSTDPSRLLTLARESNMPIDGHEWASPKLLSGRLAIQVLNCQYGAAGEIGSHRLRQIESMITNWAEGLIDSGPLEQLFYVAVQLQEPRPSQEDTGWQSMAHERGKLAEAYRLSLKERQNLVRQAGLPLIQDLHLLDATSSAQPVERDDQQMPVSSTFAAFHKSSEKPSVQVTNDDVIDDEKQNVLR